MGNLVYTVNTPTGPGAYLLLVARGGGMFGGIQTSAFLIDSLTIRQDGAGRAVALEGYLNTGDLVVAIPYGTQFLLVRRNDVEAIEPLEAAKRHKAEQDAVDKVFDTPTEITTPTATPAEVGQYL